MTGTEPNGRIRLSVRDIVGWAVLLAAILGSWYDGRSQQALTQQGLALHIEAEREVRAELKQENDLLWRAVREVQASERPKPRR